MQVTELPSEGLKKSYRIVVDSARIQAQMEVELRAAGEQVKIPGFRPGYIPMKVLQQRYGKSVQPDVLKQVINQTTTEAISERKLRPTLTPQVNIETYQEGGDLAFTTTFEIFPEVPEIDYNKVTLNRKIYEITDKEMDEAVGRVAERTPKMTRRDEGAKAASGDVVTIDFKGTVDGVAFNGGAAKDFQLELGSKQFIEGFEDQLIGVKEGEERTVTVTFPKDYPGKDIAGKEADFAVTVHEIHTKEPSDIDEDFVKSKGFTNMAAFHDAIRSQMTKEYDQLVRNGLKKELFDILEGQYDFELPQGMVDLEFSSIWQRLKEAKAQGDKTIAGKSDDELRAEYLDIAKRRVKLGLLLAEVGSRNKIQITREELTRAIMQQASQYPGQENKVMDFYRKNPDRVEDLRGPILEEKAVDYVLSKVAFNDHKVSVEELIATEEDMEDSEDNDGKSERSAKKEAKPAKKKSESSDKESTSKAEESSKKPAAKKKANK